MAVATTPARGPAVHDETEMLISGSEAVAEGLALADIDVVTAYPIRPYDTVMQAIAKKIANGKLVAEYIVAEGEHSQFEIVKHASTVGARVFCGSSGVGWMYAMEAITVTPALRVPMVALVGNRALDDPGAFGVEHNDALSVRDLGWLLVWIDTAQEAIEVAMPVGLYSGYEVFAPCGMCSRDGIIGYLDSPDTFLAPDRMKAGLLWFTRGYVDYQFPNNARIKGAEVKELEVILELSSEVPGTSDNWPSDITLSINGKSIGAWTSPGDFGDRRGLL